MSEPCQERDLLSRIDFLIFDTTGSLVQEEHVTMASAWNNFTMAIILWQIHFIPLLNNVTTIRWIKTQDACAIMTPNIQYAKTTRRHTNYAARWHSHINSAG